MNLRLQRATSIANGTPGLLEAGDLRLFTIELPWRDNTADQSCVPPGTYQLMPYVSPKHGSTWQLYNPALNVYTSLSVPQGGRSAIEIHVANFARELEGCIGIGMTGEPMLDPVLSAIVPAVQDSLKAMIGLRALLGADSTHTLTISTGGA
jgi:hypothetical protein